MSLPAKACCVLARRLGHSVLAEQALSGQSPSPIFPPPRCYADGCAAERPDPCSREPSSQAPACVPSSVDGGHDRTGGGSSMGTSAHMGSYQALHAPCCDESQWYRETFRAPQAASTSPLSSLQPPLLRPSHWRSIHCSSRVNSPEAAAEAADVSISRAGPLAEYRHRVAQGTLHEGDEFQVKTISMLQDLYDATIGVGGDNPFKVQTVGFWSRLLPRQRKVTTRGLYLWGGVGTGKTMLMDLFYDELPSWLLKKRIHFHDFMLSIHSKLQSYKGQQDPLARVAEEQAGEALLLCLDEFMVTDVADAMILNRLFASLFEHGVVLVATSNRPPVNLYENGLQRELFLPFIALLEDRCIVHQIGSATDYRKLTKIQQGKYFVGKDADELLEAKVKMLTEGHVLEERAVDVVMGRKLKVPRGANGVAWLHFQELCENPLGAADFFALCKNFHTVAIDGVPVFGAARRSAAYRFVTFIDVMYESKTGLVISAEAPPVELFERVVTFSQAPKRSSRRPTTSRSEEADLIVDDELGFAKDRTISRLIEMQSSEYERYVEISHDITL